MTAVFDKRPFRIFLGASCVLGPLLFALIGLTYASNQTLGPNIRGLELPLKLIAPASDPERNAAQEDKAKPPAPSAGESGGGAPAKSRVEADSKAESAALRPLVRQIVARQGYAVMSAFHFVACAFAAVVALGMLAKSIADWRQIILAAPAALLLGYLIAAYDGAYDHLRYALVEGVLTRADAAPTYGAPDAAATCPVKPCLAVKGERIFADGTARLQSLVRLNTVVGLAAVWLILFALATTTVSLMPPAEGAPADTEKPWLAPAAQKEQGWRLRLLLYAAAAVLATSVLTSKALLEWPSTLVEGPGAQSLRALTSSMLSVWGAAYTLVLLTAFGPAFAAWLLDREEYRALSDPDRAKLAAAAAGQADKSLDILPTSTITSILSLLTPVLAPAALDLVKMLFGYFGGSG